ncbi:homoserine kinase [Methanocella conradii HZ254]|uniref:Homoserine kinase n=1 Tax=Methanocella conradii (strain DSM 24694 / JCM 17849 / CGMCC 1.5162 / HZ254) TaxID=1041930 RepID=H8I5U1_METCZ|nr:homoserine kinase [Methanocella conradii]AFC99758.1 homoserine kinase [Methanocella conradii HZ254]
MDRIRVKASATSANLGAGFDVLGLALDEPYDVIEVEPADRLAIKVIGVGSESIPLDPERNTAGLVAKEMGRDVLITIYSGIRPASGLGSSAAPAAGVAFAINELFSLGYTREELVPIAARGEVAAAGVAHADNVGPCLLGGLTIVCGGQAESLEMPEVGVVAIMPDVKVSTRVAREALPACIPLREMVQNVGKACMLVAGAAKKDPYLIGRSLADSFNEKYRSPLIKGYEGVKAGAMREGAYGVAISGSGPTMIALCPRDRAKAIEKAMRDEFLSYGISCESFVTRVGRGVKII